MAAASLATTQCFATSMFLLSSTSGATHQRLVGVRQVPSRTRRVACQAEGGSSTPKSSPTPTPPPPPPSPKVSTKFIDVLAFSGPAPERINGRLAMIGFVTALAVEVASGNDLVAQLSSGGTPWFLWVSGLLSAASLVPLLQGVSIESKSGGVMSSKAEMWNGRAAMLGLVALVLTEYLKGGPLV